MAKDPQADNTELPADEELQDGASVEDTADVSDDSGHEIDTEALAEKLAQAETAAQESKDKMMRAFAEMDNLRKRQERELEGAHKYALENFAKELLGVWDSLELGLNAASEDSIDKNTLIEGSELTLKMLGDVMTKFGVEQLNPEGEAFDPEEHQAMSMQPREDVEPNTVVVVVQKGYRLNGRLIRPAMVMVSQAS